MDHEQRARTAQDEPDRPGQPAPLPPTVSAFAGALAAQESTPLQRRGSAGRPPTHPASLRAMFRGILAEHAAAFLSDVLAGKPIEPVVVKGQVQYRPASGELRARALDLAGRYGLGVKQAPRQHMVRQDIRAVVVALPALDPDGDGAGDRLMAVQSPPLLIGGPTHPTGARPAGGGDPPLVPPSHPE